jgi:hypothetical protein
MTLNRFFLLSKSIMYVALASIFFCIPWIINYQLTEFRNDVKIQLNSFRSDTTALVDRRFESLQSFISSLYTTTDKRLDSIEKKTFILASDLRKDSFEQIGILNTNLNNQIGTLNTNLNTQIGILNTNLNNQETVLNASISDVTKPYSLLPFQFISRFDRQTDCSLNALCWQNLTTDVLTNFRFTGRDISASSKVFNDGFPILMGGFNQSVTNFAKITDNIKRITTVHWYDRAIGIAVNGSLIYSRLNPISIPITSIRYLTSQK